MPPKYQRLAKNVTGKVSWFNRNLGSGRIIVDEFGEVFVKHSKISRPVNRNGDNFLLPSQHVICDILNGPKGLQAANVKVEFAFKSRSFSNTSRSRNRSSRPPSECSGTSAYAPSTAPDQSDVAVVEKDLRGEVLEFDADTGRGLLFVRQYGKIACFSEFIDSWGECASEQCLQPTQIVKCDIGRARSGALLAINVYVICEANAPVGRRPDDVIAPAGRRPGDVIAPAGRRPDDVIAAAERKTGDVIARDLVGEVLSFNCSRKYGFIRLEGSDNVYFNHYAFQNVCKVSPQQVVKFDLAHGPKSQMALNIRLDGDPEIVEGSNFPHYPIDCSAESNWTKALPELPDLLSSNSQKEPIVEKMEKLKISEPKVKTKTRSASKQKSLCNICQDDLEDAVTVPCGHLFCRECIDEWLSVNPSCPIDGRAISRKSVKPASLVQSAR